MRRYGVDTMPVTLRWNLGREDMDARGSVYWVSSA